jgi:DNA-binding LytR/AlgR family response regulator
MEKRMATILIAHRNPISAERLRKLIEAAAPNSAWHVLGAVSSVPALISVLAGDNRPDLLLLDSALAGDSSTRALPPLLHSLPLPLVAMVEPGRTCPGVVERLFDGYASGIIDCLYDPVMVDRLWVTLGRAQRAIAGQAMQERDQRFFIVNTQRQQLFVPLEEVPVLWAESKAVVMWSRGRQWPLSGCVSLDEVERRFKDTYLRVQRGYLVLPRAIRTLRFLGDKRDHGQLSLEAFPHPVPVSRRGFKCLQQHMRDSGINVYGADRLSLPPPGIAAGEGRGIADALTGPREQLTPMAGIA